MSRNEFLVFLYKNKLNDITLVDVVDKLSKRTLERIMKDLSIMYTEPNVSEDTYIFTDGGCKNNGKASAKGGYAVFFTDDSNNDLYNLNTVHTLQEPTNQKAELSAIEKALQIVGENNDIFNGKKLTIVSDSMYSIKCITEWSKNWEKNNWKTSKGEEVKNVEIIKRIIDMTKRLNVSYKHVLSHTTEPKEKDSLAHYFWYGNNKVDGMINELLQNQ